MTGIVMMNNAFPEASRHDIQTLIPIMFGVVVLVLALLTRSLVGTVGTVGTIGTIGTIGAIGAIGPAVSTAGRHRNHHCG